MLHINGHTSTGVATQWALYQSWAALDSSDKVPAICFAGEREHLQAFSCGHTAGAEAGSCKAGRPTSSLVIRLLSPAILD